MWKRLLTIGIVLYVMMAMIVVVNPVSATATSGWGTEHKVNPDAIPPEWYPSLAMNSKGDAILTYDFTNSGSVYTDIYARFYLNGVWTDGTVIDQPSNDRRGPVAAISDNGSAIVVWSQSDGAHYALYGSEYYPSFGWTSPHQLSSSYNSPVLASLKMNGRGNASLVWSEPANPVIKDRLYSPEQGWQNEVTLSTTTSGYLPVTGIDANGDVLTVWFDGSSVTHLTYSRYVPGNGWIMPIMINQNNQHPNSLSMAMNSKGEAVIAYVNSTLGGDHSVNVTSFRGSTWSSTTCLTKVGDYKIISPNVDINDQGQAMVVWTGANNTNQHVLYSTYVSAWSSVALLAQGDQSNNAKVALNSQGEGTVIWTQGMTTHVFAANVHGGTVSAPQQLDTISAGWTQPEISVARDGQGDVMAIFWKMNDDSFWASLYTMPDVTPPALALTSPSTVTTTNASMVNVAGTTEPGASVMVDGIQAQVSPTGTFSVDVALREGNNTISISATDASGNAATKTVTVSYVNDMRTDLSNAQSGLRSAQNDVSSLKTELLASLAIATIAVILAALSLMLFIRGKKK